MLSKLHIENYVLIDSLDVSFPEGLIIITGQTGAGKSILLGALSLLTGAKADASAISESADSCVVEAEFTCEDLRIKEILDNADVEWDDGTLLVRRVLSKTGRSRCFVNDCPVPVSLLQELSGLLVDIHSQHRSLLLNDPSFQLSVLDCFAGNSGKLRECAEVWKRIVSCRSELSTISGKLDRIRNEADYNRMQWEKLDGAHLREGELAELEEEQKLLANADMIKESFGAVISSLDPEESDVRCAGVAESLKEARRQLGKIAAYMPETVQLAERLDSARIEIEDILGEVSLLDAGIMSSRERLEQVEGRMSEIYALLNRFNCHDEAGLIAVRDALSGSLLDSTLLEDRKIEIESALARDESLYEGICSGLHAARIEAAPRFSSEICSSLRFLELERSVFDVRIDTCNAGASGTDKVQFLFSSDGKALAEVSKCASGGELSRIMLCLKDMMARFMGMPTLVFDEIDTGVSGSVADRMGRMICRMGENMQVLSITHLPQVAAKGNAHYVVSKSVDPTGRTVSGIREVSGRDRVMEIARLLSGSEISAAAVANAESLLDSRC